MNQMRNLLLAIAVASLTAPGLASAQAQTQCPLTYIAQDNCSNGVPYYGCENNFGFISEQVTWQAVVDATPGCCQNITYPTCKQPVDPMNSTAYDHTWTNTLTQTQSFDAGITLGAIWRWLTGASWKVTKGKTYTETSTTKITFAAAVVNCGNHKYGFLGTDVTITHESRTNTDGKFYQRDQTNTTYISKDRNCGPLQTWDPCLDRASGPLCQPVSVDVRCTKITVGS